MNKAQASLPGAAPERLNYATGMLLDAEDFQAEQDYHRGRLARALAYAVGYGTLAGLVVSHEPARPASGGEAAVEERLMVSPGLALDRLGRLIEVPREACLPLARWYAAQPAAELGQAWFGAGGAWSGAPAGVVLDVFVRFITCPRGKTPVFASTALDSFDSLAAARLRDSFEIQVMPRQEAELPRPAVPWAGVTPGDATSLRQAIFAAWHQGSGDGQAGALEPLPEHLPKQDTSALFLARVLVPADAGPPGQRPPRRMAEPVQVRNDLRPFLLSSAALARWLNIPLTAEA